MNIFENFNFKGNQASNNFKFLLINTVKLNFENIFLLYISFNLID